MPKRKKTLTEGHKPNFETLRRAFCNGDVALMECTEKATGELVAVICTCVWDEATREYVMQPFARMFKDNPYDEWEPPIKSDKKVVNSKG